MAIETCFNLCVANARNHDPFHDLTLTIKYLVVWLWSTEDFFRLRRFTTNIRHVATVVTFLRGKLHVLTAKDKQMISKFTRPPRNSVLISVSRSRKMRENRLSSASLGRRHRTDGQRYLRSGCTNSYLHTNDDKVITISTRLACYDGVVVSVDVGRSMVTT